MFHETHFTFHSHTQPTHFPAGIYLPSVSQSCFDDNFLLSSESLSNYNSRDATISTPHNDHSDSSILHDLSEVVNHSIDSHQTDAVRQSTRVDKPTAYLTDYHCNNVTVPSVH